MPGAGKTTLARRLESQIRAQSLPVEVLDEGLMRTILSDELGFTREDREANVRRIGFVCSLLSRNGVVAVASVVSPYRDTRREVRLMHEPGRFLEVFVDCPLDQLIQRDRWKGYRKEPDGQLPNPMGPDPYEPPERPEVVIETHLETAEQCVGKILARLLQPNHSKITSAGSLVSATKPA
jgi:adenylyl-sulfate kinase